MGRKNGNTNNSGSKPQHHKNTGGSKQSRQREHFENLVFGDTPSVQSVQRPSNHLQSGGVRPLSFVRTAIEPDAANMRDFFETSKAQIDEKSKDGIRLQIISPRVARIIYSKFGRFEASRLLGEYKKEHSANIGYSISRLYSFPGSKYGEVLLAAHPTLETKDKINQDILDQQSTIGISEEYRHTSLIIAKYTDQETCDTARDMLYESVEKQGGVLLTFGGVHI